MMERKKTATNMSAIEGVSTAPSRYFGGGASVFNGIGLFSSRDSVTTTDSFTEEHHTMTKAELEYLPSNIEQDLLDEVTAQVKERIVFGQGSTSWGLRWECGTVDEPDYLLGGWLSQVSRSMLSSGVSNGQTRFCVLDDNNRQFQQCLDERLKVRRFIPYDEINTVRPRCQESKKDPKENVWYLQVFGKGVKWELIPIARNDRDVILRWTAALQYRSGSYDSSIAGDARRAHKAAVWAQSKYRMWKAKERVQRRREKKNALMNRLASAIGFNSWEDGDSDDEDDGYFAQYSNQVYEYGSAAISNAWATVGSWLGLGGASSTIHESDEEKETQEDSTSDKSKRISTAVQYANELPPLLPGEVEDEVWENQRWTPATGWTSKTLGKTERCAFTDRLGRGSFQKPNDMEGGPAIPGGWEALGPWKIDMSGVNKGRCDKEGYCYSLDWPLLDADLARGKFNVSQGTKDFVRRRRWYRRRACSKANNLLDTTSPILCIGWLGSRSPGTGRWHSRLFVLTRPGLQVGGVITKCPAITQFRFSFKEYESVIAEGGVDGAKWRALTEKQATTIELDPRLCRIDETVANSKYPGYFALVLDAKQQKRRTFNANDSVGRETWCNAVRNALAEAAKANRPKTMRLVGGAFETTCYPTIVMDSMLLAPVDAVEEALFQSPSVLAAVHVRSGFRQSESGSWNGTTKKVTYIDDKRGGKVTETWVRARTEPGKGFVVDRRIEAPGAQFGEDYAIKCRFVLIAAEMMGEPACRVLVSVDVEFVKQTMMVGFITSGARNALTVSLREIWLPAVVGYLQGKGLLVSEPRKNGQMITWGSSSVGSSTSKYSKQDSGHIEVGKI